MNQKIVLKQQKKNSGIRGGNRSFRPAGLFGQRNRDAGRRKVATDSGERVVFRDIRALEDTIDEEYNKSPAYG
jgi:hypothetical protein